jgi:hypothetical protein
MNTEGTGFYTCKECHKTESLQNHTAAPLHFLPLERRLCLPGDVGTTPLINCLASPAGVLCSGKKLREADVTLTYIFWSCNFHPLPSLPLAEASKFGNHVGTSLSYRECRREDGFKLCLDGGRNSVWKPSRHPSGKSWLPGMLRGFMLSVALSISLW